MLFYMSYRFLILTYFMLGYMYVCVCVTTVSYFRHFACFSASHLQSLPAQANVGAGANVASLRRGVNRQRQTSK